MRAGGLEFLNDRRRRSLAILAAAALVASALAILALAQRAAEVAPKFEPRLMFPELAAHLTSAATLRITTAKTSFDVSFTPERGWSLPQHDNYPANIDEVARTLRGLAKLELVAPRTANPAWHVHLGLVAPDAGGEAVRLTLLDEGGTVLADVLAGKTEDLADLSGRTGLYVRKPGDDQTWLALAAFTPQADAAQWLDKSVLSIGRERIREADAEPPSGAAYTVAREKPDEADFALVDMPEGRELSYASAPNGVAAAIVGFSFDDVRRAEKLDFTKAARLTTTTFDGLKVEVRVAQIDGAYWATVGASADAADSDAAKEAAAINERAAGWAYQLPAYKARQFVTEREALLKPLEAPASAETRAP